MQAIGLTALPSCQPDIDAFIRGHFGSARGRAPMDPAPFMEALVGSVPYMGRRVSEIRDPLVGLLRYYAAARVAGTDARAVEARYVPTSVLFSTLWTWFPQITGQWRRSIFAIIGAIHMNVLYSRNAVSRLELAFLVGWSRSSQWAMAILSKHPTARHGMDVVRLVDSTERRLIAPTFFGQNIPLRAKDQNAWTRDEPDPDGDSVSWLGIDSLKYERLFKKLEPKLYDSILALASRPEA